MIGKKLRNLEILRQNNFPIPDFVRVTKDTDVSKLNIKWELSAVRSSASIEDGENSSFAGQFDTYLNVPQLDIASMVGKCFESMENAGMKEYAKHHNIDISELGMDVIVQKMVNSKFSGVCFTANPQGLLNEMVIVVGQGTGDNVVEDKVDTTTYYYNTTDRVYYYEGKEDFLTEEMINNLVELAANMQPILGEFLDIEFAIENEKIYILQARDITTIDKENMLILDNSNIVESYPGVSLPLTCSFVDVVYSGIFKSISRRVLKNEKELSKYENVFSNMVGNVNGRIYYKISNWYTVIKFLPLNKKIIPIWQDMMGVKIKSYDKNNVELPAFIRIKTYFNVIWEMLNVPRNMKKLNSDFVRINQGFYSKYHKNITAEKLVELYKELYDTLLACWDVTLLNDVYSFVFTGMVKKRLGTESNRIISGISNIESLKPIQEMVRLAYDSNSLTKEQYKERFDRYIREYGDRNLEELKLESKTFRSNPELLAEKLQQYNEDKEKLKEMYGNLNKETVSVKPKGLINKWLAKEAARGIANREISRLNRSRIFGIVRLIFTRLGEIFEEEGLLEKSQDVFWITVDEAFSLVKNKRDMKNIVEKRKREYELYRCLPAYQRLIFSGREFNKKHKSVNAHNFYVDKKALRGTPCSDGVVEGEALVITDVTEVKDYQNKILVTKMTDPGWVFLLVKAKGVISEKGSLLSHTAIISRELKVPSVVGVEGALSSIRTGDVVRLNGDTGEIEKLGRKQS